MQPSPLVSICIPVYNGDKFIVETLEWCLNQTYTNLEIIISDNCSTDRTVEIIKSYKDPRIKLFSNETNKGLIYNFEKVLSYAQGKYISFLGADDGMEPDAIEKGVKILEDPAHSDVVLVNTYMKIINDEGRLVHTKKFIFGGGKFSSFWGIRSNLLYGTNTIGELNASLFRKETYDKIPDPKFRIAYTWTIDLELKNELLLFGKAYVIPEALGKFRISAQSNSSKELKFVQAKLFRKFAYALYKDKRYKLSFFWVITATINSFLLEIARNIFYLIFIRNKRS